MIDNTFYVIIADASKWMKINDTDTKNHISRQINKYNKNIRWKIGAESLKFRILKSHNPH